MRLPLVEFLIQSTQELDVGQIVKYAALSLFADRFYPSLSRSAQGNDKANWLLQPVRESNLQLFALISIWISSKFLGDTTIKEQHFTTRDFLEAEVVFLQVLDFEIGTANNAFVFFEELYIQFKGIAKVGELLNFEACMDIMDLVYEKEETSLLHSSRSLAASILACCFIRHYSP
ncbi:hypothetical protein I3843_06G053500 [Carya illinoinensis]|uniref:B-like cyclin n=1 Tax=Carya illinoinensis TaxID=32201 RepID=A0A922ESM1_CARIL|nr:hypothetical protein I3760_06G057700 [Carya illinoinensis]KAG2701723.1 hypothetical protein I3760_06G057700 [Carya illinoinensis]KAG6707982.1 hypothetical protein I3842_06G058100 [Carya illinoinensis]KAG7974550.1 hypothetical protein I3843_06G053500 [Carya illinoinensis]